MRASARLTTAVGLFATAAAATAVFGLVCPVRADAAAATHRVLVSSTTTPAPPDLTWG